MIATPGMRVGYASDPGRRRELNEDSFLILTAPAIAPGIEALLTVADGMGGHQSGDAASWACVDELSRLFLSQAYQQDVAFDSHHADYYVVVLKQVLERVNEHIRLLSLSHARMRDMGTTATVLLVADWQLFWGHVGDSRAYLLRDGSLRRLTQDHTWVAEQVASGQMTVDQAAHHPRRSVLTRSLGNAFLVRVDRGRCALEPGDWLVLCTDGLSCMVNDPEIRGVLGAGTDPQMACEQLLDLANQRGGPDNITVLAAQLLNDTTDTNIAGGIAVGPMHRNRIPQSLSDTLKVKRRRSAGDRRRRIVWAARTALVLLGGSLLSGVGALALATGLSVTFSPIVAAIAAVAAFAVGSFLGWLLRSACLE